MDNKVKAAPAANTPLRRVAQDKSCFTKYPLYFVWYAFLADPANRHASAAKKLIHERMKEKTAQVAEQPETRPLPQQRHRVTPLRTVWLRSRRATAARP